MAVGTRFGRGVRWNKLQAQREPRSLRLLPRARLSCRVVALVVVELREEREEHCVDEDVHEEGPLPRAGLPPAEPDDQVSRPHPEAWATGRRKCQVPVSEEEEEKHSPEDELDDLR